MIYGEADSQGKLFFFLLLIWFMGNIVICLQGKIPRIFMQTQTEIVKKELPYPLQCKLASIWRGGYEC